MENLYNRVQADISKILQNRRTHHTGDTWKSQLHRSQDVLGNSIAIESLSNKRHLPIFRHGCKVRFI